MNEEIRIWDAVPGHDWDDACDLKGYPTWILDPTHSWPRLMAMEGWFWMKYMNGGAAYAAEKISQPSMKGPLRRLRKGADYLAMIPITGEKEVKEREVIFKERILSFSRDFPQWWEKSKNELMERYNGLKRFDPDQAGDMDFANHLYDLCDTARMMWNIHWLGLLTVSNAWVVLEDLCKELWDLDDSSPEFQKLMSGFDNKMLQVDERMWQLSRSALEKGIADVILNTEPENLFEALEQRESGKAWLMDFREFLEEDGWRMTHLHVFHEPTWVEDPIPAIERIKNFIRKDDVAFAIEKKRDILAKEREETLAALLPKVPDHRKDEFLKLLAAAQLAGAYNEEHNYYCENYCHGLIRRGLLAIGRHLVKAGVMDQAEDVLFLNPPEVEGVMPGPEHCNLRHIIERRRREWEEWHEVDAPPILTSRSSIEEAWEKDILPLKNPITGKIISAPPPEIKPALKADIYGLAASGGVTEGPARVVITAEQLAEVKEGDILIAPFTMSTWTPIFAVIAGVVTDAGGPLSHTAIVSREYGIPAVVNTNEATKKIQSGQRIKVDGSEGVVYILD